MVTVTFSKLIPKVACISLLLVLVLSVSCSNDEKFVSEVDVSLGEWFIAAPQDPIAADDVLFVVENVGSMVHEIEIFRKDGQYQEFEIGEIEDIAPGESPELQLPLEPGVYELICVIVEKTDMGEILNHYELGMHTILTVVE